jgi:hypothetical protein
VNRTSRGSATTSSRRRSRGSCHSFKEGKQKPCDLPAHGSRCSRRPLAARGSTRWAGTYRDRRQGHRSGWGCGRRRSYPTPPQIAIYTGTQRVPGQDRLARAVSSRRESPGQVETCPTGCARRPPAGVWAIESCRVGPTQLGRAVYSVHQISQFGLGMGFLRRFPSLGAQPVPARDVRGHGRRATRKIRGQCDERAKAKETDSRPSPGRRSGQRAKGHEEFAGKP